LWLGPRECQFGEPGGYCIGLKLSIEVEVVINSGGSLGTDAAPIERTPNVHKVALDTPPKRPKIDRKGAALLILLGLKLITVIPAS
jgi:hypothetical protein